MFDVKATEVLATVITIVGFWSNALGVYEVGWALLLIGNLLWISYGLSIGSRGIAIVNVCMAPSALLAISRLL